MLRIHHPPQGELTVSHFDVSINGKPTIPWYCRVSAVPFNTVWPGFQRPIEQTEIASFISFEMQEPVELRLKAWKSFSEVVVRSLSRKIHPTVNGREITFSISEPGAYTVELDGMNSALHKRADGCHQRIFRKDVIDRATQLIHEDNVIDFVAECAARIQTQESTILPVLEAKLREVKKESASRFDLEAGSALYASDSLRNNIIFNCATLTILGYCGNIAVVLLECECARSVITNV